MKSLVIDRSDVNIRVWMSRLRIESQGRLLYEFAPRSEDLPSVILLRSVWGVVTHEAAYWLSKHGIQIIYTEWDSRQFGTLIPLEFQNNGNILIHQVKCFLDSKLRFEMAKQIIFDKTGEEIPSDVKSIPQLLNFEGLHAQNYWVEYAKQVNETGTSLKFGGRGSKRMDNQNTTNEISCALNYLYGFMTHAVILKSIIAVGLNPAISFLHNPITNISLCFDILEPMRHYADESLLESLRYGEIDKQSFSRSRSDGYLLRLRPDACKILLARFDNYMEHNVDFRPSWSPKTQSWKREATILEYAQQFRKRVEATSLHDISY